MSTLDQIRQGISNTWHSISEGWQQFSDRAAQALTRFNPVHRSDDNDSLPSQVERNASRWGLLAAEIHEDRENVYVKIEAPGMDAENFDIQVVDDTLVVRGEKRVQRERNEGRYHLMECAYGSFERAMPLPAHVNDQEAGACYKKGVLSITLPKQNHTVSSRIKVNDES
jgi:HSP20 family protein